jgi:hypothetical protein
MVLSAVDFAAASSGPKRRLSNVHNGLVEVALRGPTASDGVARTLAPEGKLTVSALSLYGFLRRPQATI